MKIYRIVLVVATIFCCSCTFAQSLSTAHSLYQQGKYTEAAKVLRPLADGGNAEAQDFAAMLFLNGTGVPKNLTQAAKYAKMAADQGNSGGICKLHICYVEWNKAEEGLGVLKNYIDRFPSMMFEAPGLRLAECYIDGTGVEKDEKAGWGLCEKYHSDYIDYAFEQKDRHFVDKYLDYKARSTGKSCVEDYADYLYRYGTQEQYKRVEDYVYDVIYNGSFSVLEVKARTNGWAMARLAAEYESRGNMAMAKSMALKSRGKLSNYGKALAEKYEYKPTQFTTLKMSSWPARTQLESVTLDYDVMYVRVRYTHAGSMTGLNTNKSAYILCNGKTYPLVSSTLPLAPSQRSIRHGDVVTFTMTFKRIPDGQTTFSMVDGNWEWNNITFSNGTRIDHYEF